jgi:LPS sulfotransferase NodH
MKRIFIVGCPRSGTTLLQSMLNAHSQLNSFKESHFFMKNFRRFEIPFHTMKKVYLPKRHIQANLNAFFEENDFEKEIKDELEAKKSSFSTPKRWTEYFVQSLDMHTLAQSNMGWVEKTPMHLHHIPFISENIPDAYFIHIIRDGKNTVASLYDVANSNSEIWGERTLENCVSRWNDDVSISLEWLQGKHKKHIGVRYEELIENPQEVLRGICDFLGVEWDPNMMNYQSSASQVIKKHEAWKKNNFQALQVNSRYEKLAQEEKAYIEKELDRELASQVPSFLLSCVE